jgi:small conductance mechanosensitive channel
VAFIIFLLTVAVVAITLWVAHLLLIKRHAGVGNEFMFPRQLAMLGLILLGLLVLVLVIPIDQSARNQLIGLFGILVSGVIAFSSTTIISNLMAGIVLRISKPFKVGDFIRVGDHFGRVVERGLFDTEIQTETRELISLPNTYCIKNPLSTLLSSGTIISASLSLGYDIDQKQVEMQLTEAARNCGLKEPFVHILELGNFAVTYRVSGFLDETKLLISSKSKLYSSILDRLHSQGIEIMSPTYMNQRQLKDGEKAIPTTTVVSVAGDTEISVEEIAFDKAEEAEKIENEKQRLRGEIEALETSIKEATSDEQKKIQQASLEQRQNTLRHLEEASAEH